MTTRSKPKWGFLPNPTYLSPESKPIKTRTCRTCMHTHLKQTGGENAAVHYCPLDLFSGSRGRLEGALEGLWDSWTQSNGTINNLRIFHNGKMVLPTDVGIQTIQSTPTDSDRRIAAPTASMVTRMPLIASWCPNHLYQVKVHQRFAPSISPQFTPAPHFGSSTFSGPLRL